MTQRMITVETVKNSIGKRKKEIHKGDCGRVLLLCGSHGMMGAAVLAGRAALRSGAGLVQLALPETLFPIAQIAVPEATCVGRAFQTMDLSRYDAAGAGPGLGEGEDSVRQVNQLLTCSDVPLILDADGLNIVARHGLLDTLRARQSRGARTIITPHMGEAERLLVAGGLGGKFDCKHAGSGGSDRRLAIAGALAKLTGAVTVLKGAGTVVATSDGEAYINTTGNPGMATGGSGDVLTGMITGLWG